MNQPKIPDRKLFYWPVSAILIGALAAMNPFYTPDVPLSIAAAAWCIDMMLVLTLAATPISARAGVLISGVFFAIPCFVVAPPLLRAWLMCLAALPFAIISAAVLFPTIIGFRERLYFLATWGYTREVKRRAPAFKPWALLHLIAATAIFAAAYVAVITIPIVGVWQLLRWLAGGILIMAFAEMGTACHNLLTPLMGLSTPNFMQSPILSASVNEFWTKRWNPATSWLFHFFCFKPLSHYGVNLALFATFIASGIGHALLAFMAIGQWNCSLLCGAFFVVQPPFIILERSLKIKQWPPFAKHTWTLSVLTLTSPLFVEPVLQVAGTGWNKWGPAASSMTLWTVLPPVIAMLGVAFFIVILLSLASLVSCPKPAPIKPMLEPKPALPLPR